MQKISRIIPGSARVSGVDMKSANPVRPGTPAFGRPVAESSEMPRETMTTAQKAVGLREELNNQKRGMEGQTDLVQKMTDQFFMAKNISANAPDTRSTGELVASDFEEGTSVVPQMPKSREFVPPGTFVDVVA